METLSTQEHPSAFGLHRWDSMGRPTGELSLHIEVCEHCQCRLAKMAEEQEAFLSRFPSLPTPPVHEALPWKDRFFGWLSLVHRPHWVTAFSCMVLAMLWLSGSPARRGSLVPSNDGGSGRVVDAVPIRSKGHKVEWVVQRAHLQLFATSSFVFRPGDRLGMRITPSSDCYATLLLIDEKGLVQQWLPRPGTASLRVRAGISTTLPESILFQPPIQRQGLVLLLTKKPIDLEVLRVNYAQWRQSGKRMGTQLPQWTSGWQSVRWIGLR